MCRPTQVASELRNIPLGPTEFVWETVFGYGVKPIYLLTPEQALEFGIELRRQGNNINQIAHKMNSGLMTGWSQALAGINAGYVRLNHRLAVNSADR